MSMPSIFAHPHTGKGFMGYVILGFGGGMVALLVSALFPSLIPVSATTVRL
jgi:hypothetical protein